MGWGRVLLEMVICGWGCGSDCRSLWLDGENHTRLNENIRDGLVAQANGPRVLRQNQAWQLQFATGIGQYER